MKVTTLFLVLVLSLSVLACSQSTPAQDSNAPPPPAPSTPSGAVAVIQTTPLAREQAELTEQFYSKCDDTTDPAVIAAALPSAYQELTLVGEIVSDKTSMPAEDGKLDKMTNVLKTLTKNDEYYVSITAQDYCGINMAKAAYMQLTPGPMISGEIVPVTINGRAAMLLSDTDTGRNTVNLLLKNRLFVEVQSDPEVGKEVTLSIARAIDFDAIERAMPQ